MNATTTTVLTAGNILSGASVLGFLGILAKLVFDWWRSRRRERAEGELAERSVGTTLAERNLSVVDAQIVVLEKANAAERASYERRIKALESDVRRLTKERDDLQTSVTQIRLQMTELQEQFDAVKRQLDDLQPHR